jgi:hypothetical protein
MNDVNRLITKVAQVERLLSEVQKQLLEIHEELDAQEKKAQANLAKEPTPEEIPPEEILRSEYEGLFQAFMNNNTQEIRDFIKGKSKNYLKSFCKINNLPMDTTKTSKDKIADETLQWMRQRKAIGHKPT